jgi:quinoprotein glucose dehydrogenase
MARTKFQATPLLVEDSVIFCSPFNEVIALDPGSGAQKWRYDPKISTNQRPGNRYTCRGVAYWVDQQASERAVCRARIFMGTNDVRVIALDARTGIPLRRFWCQWRDQARDRKTARVAGRIPDHLRAGGKPGRRHCRLCDFG